MILAVLRDFRNVMRGRERNRELSMQVDDRVVDLGQDVALPSVETTMRFLALCDRYGSHEAAVAAVSGAGGLECRACPTATTGRSAAVEYLQEADCNVTESGAPRRQRR